MSEATTTPGMHAPAGLAAARSALVAWIRGAGAEGREFLQVHLQATGDRFTVRHVEDRGADAAQLTRIADPYRAREVAQTTAEGAHRPLKTAPDLRPGWLFAELDERGLWTVLDYLYPACVAHWHAGRSGTLRVTHWADTAARQSGMYSAVKLLPEQAVRDTVAACCGDAVCLRRVAWGLGRDHPAPLQTEVAGEGEIDGGDVQAVVPCPEACSLFVSLARVVLSIEREPRREVPGLGSVNDTELEQVRALVAAAGEGGVEHPREGEFDLPLNRRRLRYLAVRLGGSVAEGGEGV